MPDGNYKIFREILSGSSSIILRRSERFAHKCATYAGRRTFATIITVDICRVPNTLKKLAKKVRRTSNVAKTGGVRQISNDGVCNVFGELRVCYGAAFNDKKKKKK